MPVYLYWGEDDYRLEQAVQALRDRIVDPNWATFNYDKIAADHPDAVIQGLNQAVTPPFGTGERLVWLVDTSLPQRCPEDLLTELERTLTTMPAESHLLLTARTKPDGRSKVTKLLQSQAEICEFALIPPWKIDQLLQRVQEAAGQKGVRLTTAAQQLLAEAVGNNSRRLETELEKLRLYQPSPAANPKPQPLGVEVVAALVSSTTHSSLQLADVIRRGKTPEALALISDLLNQNEPPLRIVATLSRQFRTWLWVRVMIEAGERDEGKIAQAAQVGNPKRIYFLRQEVQRLTVAKLQLTLPLLLDLEMSLKQGADGIAALQSKVIELCQCCR